MVIRECVWDVCVYSSCNGDEGQLESSFLWQGRGCWETTSFSYHNMDKRGAGSSVGIANNYGPYGPGSNPGGEEIFRTCPDRPWGPPRLL